MQLGRDAMTVRNAESTEIDRLAQLWYDGLAGCSREDSASGAGSASHCGEFSRQARRRPAERARRRPVWRPSGFCIVKGAELDQLFVAARARGSGVAVALMGDAEARLSKGGVETAWLACAIGNDRAARFYEKNGWHRVGNMINLAETSRGAFPLEVWRYEKSMRRERQADLRPADSESQ